MAPRAALLLVIAFAMIAAPLEAQRRRSWTEPIPSWGIEPMVRYSIMKDDPVLLAGGRVGRQLDSTLYLGLVGAMLLSESAETQSVRGFDRVTSLLYFGPSLELRDSVHGPLRFILRASAVAGLAGYEREADGVRSDGTTFIVGVEPEVGISIRMTRALQYSMTAGVLYAVPPGGGDAIVSGPIATMGIRLVR
jgi:hypothetical protein